MLSEVGKSSFVTGFFHHEFGALIDQLPNFQNADAKQQVTHFKFRVLDLLDTFLKKAPTSPLILDLILASLDLIRKTARNADDKEVFPKVLSLVNNSLCKVKEVPKPPVVDVERVYEVLAQVHEFLRSAPNTKAGEAASRVSLLCIRIVEAAKGGDGGAGGVGSHSTTATTATTTNGTTSQTPNKKAKKSTTGSASTNNTTHPTKSRIATIYADSLHDFVTRKSSMIRPQLFMDLINRYPEYAWEVLPDFVEMTGEGVGAKAFQLEKVYEVVAGICGRNLRKVRGSRSRSFVFLSCFLIFPIIPHL